VEKNQISEESKTNRAWRIFHGFKGFTGPENIS
jgi:hypothetical protein